MSTFLNRIREHFTDVLYIFRHELIKVVKDEGVLMFLVVVPLGYPLLYSWIYNNESLHETPVVVVDQSHSALSRQFINDCDASPDVCVKFYAEDLDEARSLVSRQLVRGIYLIPSDFSERVNRGEQATVSVYCDMSLMLAYKAVYQTAMVEAGRLGAGMNIKKAGNYTKREDAITAQPLAVDDVAMYNPSGGYGSCVLPAVLMLILQQALALGIGMAAGTTRERHRNGQLIPDDDPHYRGAYRIVWGKALCYGMIGAVAAAYLSMAVPAMFSFPQLGALLVAPAIYAGQRLLRPDRLVPHPIPRERHADHGVRLRAAAFPDWRVVAAVQHPRLLAGRLLDIPEHLRRARLHPSELNGRQPQPGAARAAHPLDSGRRLSRPRLLSLSPSVPPDEKICKQLNK